MGLLDISRVVVPKALVGLVVPAFARRPFHLADCAVYRLSPTEGWVELSDPEAAMLITITE